MGYLWVVGSGVVGSASNPHPSHVGLWATPTNPRGMGEGYCVHPQLAYPHPTTSPLLLPPRVFCGNRGNLGISAPSRSNPLFLMGFSSAKCSQTGSQPFPGGNSPWELGGRSPVRGALPCSWHGQVRVTVERWARRWAGQAVGHPSRCPGRPAVHGLVHGSGVDGSRCEGLAAFYAEWRLNKRHLVTGSPLRFSRAVTC